MKKLCGKMRLHMDNEFSRVFSSFGSTSFPVSFFVTPPITTDFSISYTHELENVFGNPDVV